MNPTATTWVDSIKSSDADEDAQSRQHDRMNKSPGIHRNGAKVKQRGRPRVEPRDETAADRRRTQIRLAQRTYRARKESTIAFLDAKVARLQKMVQNASVSMQGVYQRAVDADLARTSPAFFQELTKSVGDVVAVADESDRDSRHSDSNSDLHDTMKIEEVEQFDTAYQRLTPPPSDGDAKSGLSNSTSESARSVKENGSAPNIASTGVRGVPSVWGYEMIYETTDSNPIDQITSAPIQVSSQITHAPLGQYTPQYLPPNGLDPMSATSFVYGHHLSAPSEIALPASLAFNESSFGRWLHRASLEYVFILASQPGSREEDVKRVLSNAMKHSTLPEIASRLRYRLSRSKDETLDNPAEYARHSSGSSSPDTVVPYKMPKPEGSWLGPDEIEDYLVSKGLHIDIIRGMAYCETETMIELPLTPVNALDWSTPVSNGPSQSIPANNAYTSFARESGSSYVEQVAQPYMALATAHYPAHIMQSSQSLRQIQRNRITFSLFKLVDELVQQSSCRGKTPAVHTTNINRAWERSVIRVDPV